MGNNFFDQEAETAILSVILKSPDYVFSLKTLRAFMFSNTVNETLFSNILEIINGGMFPDVSLVESYLNSRGLLIKCGGIDYLKYLIGQNYKTENLSQYEESIVNSFIARSIIEFSAETQEKIKNTKDVGEVLSFIRQRLEMMVDLQGEGKVFSFEDMLRDTWNDLKSRIENPGIHGISTGIKELDLATGGYSPSELWFIAARASLGKTAWLCNSALSVAKKGYGCLIFSLEMNKNSLGERMIAIESGVPLIDLRLGAIDQKQVDIVTEKFKEIKNLPIYTDTFNSELNYILTTIRKYQKKFGIRVVFIDYIQLMTGRDADQTAELGRISKALKLLAKELEITIVVLSQLNRSVESREDKRPVLSDLRQSGNLEEDGDVVVFLYRDDYYDRNSKNSGILENIVRKNRQGPTGGIPVRFDLPTTKISDM